MNQYFIPIMVMVFSCGGIMTANQAFAEIDSINAILFLQTGIIKTSENQFQISNDMNSKRILLMEK